MTKTRGGDKSKIIAQGCGKNLNWSQMEDVTDMVNKQLRENFLDTHDTKIIKKMENFDIFNEEYLINQLTSEDNNFIIKQINYFIINIKHY